MSGLQMKDFVIDGSLKDLTKHHTVVMPLACYKTTINQHIQGYIPLHWHDEIQFVWIEKGKSVFQVNEDRIEVQEGDGLFINSGQLHMAEDSDQTDCTYICLNFSPSFVLAPELYATFVKPYIEATNLPYLYIDASKTWGKNILDAMVEIYQCIETKDLYYEIDITIKLTSIWKNLLNNGFQLEYAPNELVKNQRMKLMLSWIHQNYSEKIRLEDIARAGQLSRSECCRYFNRFLKSTPLHYVLDYRIQKSLYLLQQRDANITEVAYQVGFNSTSYFINKFRHTMNMTPLAYKKDWMDRDEQNVD